MKLDVARISSALLRWRRAIVFGAPAAAGLLLLAGGQGEGLDEALRSARDGIRSHAASGEIHVVEIDARSLGEIERFPGPAAYAAIIDRLYGAGARAIAFDVDFSATSTPAEDVKLAAALERAGRSVILPTFRQSEGFGRSKSVDRVPAKPFEGKAFLGSVNIFPNGEGYVREMPLGVETAGTSRPSLVTMVAERNATIGQSFAIDYSIEPSTIPRHSVIDLISGKIPASVLAGKRFIIGATAIELGDRYAVPRHGVIPGVVIQALAAETLIEGPIPQSWGGALPFGVALLLLALSLRFRTRRASVALFAVSVLAILALPLATEAWFAVSMPIAPALLALTLAMLLSAAAVAVERFLENALTDDATGLPNLAAMELAAAQKGDVSVVVARIDRFATIASGLGPAATATLVQRIADRLRFDQPDLAIYRVDASSLAWIEGVDEDEGLDTRLEALVALMRSPVECGRLVDVSLNFGVARGTVFGASQLVSNAGVAAVHAAQSGNHWKQFAEADSEEIQNNLSLLGELDIALATGQLWNAYQPKLDIAAGRIVAVEALVRWSHPERGEIRPDSFIPVIEEAGRIRDLTAHVLNEALDDALAWDKAGYSLGVAVNVSATLLADHEFIEMAGLILQSHPLPTGRVTIEVTESAAMESPERAIAALESWRALGVGISIDDYGTGQSSLGYLQKLPASELKIDKSFVQTIVTDSRNAIMVRSTIALAHELGMKAVAEGIEDAACLEMLAEMGCDTAQGYHIAKPMSADRLTEFLTDQMRQAA